MILTLTASIMYWSLQQPASDSEAIPVEGDKLPESSPTEDNKVPHPLPTCSIGGGSEIVSATDDAESNPASIKVETDEIVSAIADAESSPASLKVETDESSLSVKIERPSSEVERR